MLPSINRLTQKSDFENVRQNGKFYKGNLFSISYVKRKEPERDSSTSLRMTQLPSRFGFIVSKKISMKAHERNHIKRILREYFRKNMDNMKVGYDYVIVAKARILHEMHDKIENELNNAIDDL